MYQDHESQSQAFYAPETQYKPVDGISPRIGFVRKVYGILCCQLLLTSLFVIVCQGPLRDYLYDSASPTGKSGPFVLFIIATVVALICAIAIGCYPSVARRVPVNYFILSVFTIAEAYTVGYFTVFFEPLDVILAALLTLTLTIVLTIYAFTTKRDITMYGAFLWIAGWALLAFSLLFFWIGPKFPAYRPLVIVISILAIALYGFYLVYDVQLLMGGKRQEFSLDDYIIASVAIYLDIIILFMRILQLIGAVKNN